MIYLPQPPHPPHPSKPLRRRFSPIGRVPQWKTILNRKKRICKKKSYIEVALYLSINGASSTGATLLLPRSNHIEMLCTSKDATVAPPP